MKFYGTLWQLKQEKDLNVLDIKDNMDEYNQISTKITKVELKEALMRTKIEHVPGIDDLIIISFFK